MTYSPHIGGIDATLRDIERGFTLEKWNLGWIQRNAEEYYLKNPYIKPTNETYEELREKLPTLAWKEAYKNDSERRLANTQVEAALINFSDSLIGEGKTTASKAKKLTKDLVLKLNGIDSETGFIETQEREELYAYIAKLLAKLKKTSAIETIDEFREW